MPCDVIIGKGALNFPCEIPERGHDGPHATPSILGSVEARQAWERQQAVRNAQPGPGLPYQNYEQFQAGTQKPHPRQLTQCFFCPAQVPYEEFYVHVGTHAGHPLPQGPVQAPQPVPVAQPAPQPYQAPQPAQTVAYEPQGPPPGTPAPAPSAAVGAGSADALAAHIAMYHRPAPQAAPQPAPQPAPNFYYQPSPYQAQPQPIPQPAYQPQPQYQPQYSPVMEQAAHMAEVMDYGQPQDRTQHIPVMDYEGRAFPNGQVTNLWDDVQTALNRHSRENHSNTPDFILAQYLASALDAYETAVNSRDSWYNLSRQPA